MPTLPSIYIQTLPTDNRLGHTIPSSLKEGDIHYDVAPHANHEGTMIVKKGEYGWQVILECIEVGCSETCLATAVLSDMSK